MQQVCVYITQKAVSVSVWIQGECRALWGECEQKEGSLVKRLVDYMYVTMISHMYSNALQMIRGGMRYALC